MISVVSYLAQEPLTVGEVKRYSRIDEDAEDELIEQQIIPAARALAETRTGSIIRRGRFAEKIMLGSALSVGAVTLVETVLVDGESVAFEAIEKGRRTVVLGQASAPKEAVVTFLAGVDISHYPGVRDWLLLTCGWMYRNRELMLTGSSAVNEMPRLYVDSLLVPLSLPPAF